jgi:hypothetical protein
MSRAVSSAPWGLARWCLAVAPIPLGGGGTRTTANCPGKCSEHEIPRQPVTSGASAASARRGAEVLPATTTPPRPVQQPTGPVLRGERCSRRPDAPPPGFASRKLIYSDPDLTRQRGLDGRSGDYGWPPGAIRITQSSGGNCRPGASAFQAG